MPDFALVTKETQQLAKRILPFALVLFGVLAVIRQPLTGALAGVCAGTAFAIWNFWLLGRAAARAAVQGDPDRAQKIVVASYVRRYALTAVFLVAVMLSSWINIPGAVIPLFFPKISFMLFHLKRKEENKK